jgi:hypothetical protein
LINKKGKYNNIKLYLMPKRLSEKLRKEYLNKIKYPNDISNKKKKNTIRNRINNKNTSDILSLSNFYENKNKNKINESLFKKNKIYNDMKQINRFRQIKKELSEERVKINNMMSEFFKNPLYNKYNHKELLLELLKQKNHIYRPRSALG